MTSQYVLNWPMATIHHRRALEILALAPETEILPNCPDNIRSAMHDLWICGCADRSLDPLRYRISSVGKKLAENIMERQNDNQ